MPLPPFLERFRRGTTSQTASRDASSASPASSSDVEAMRVRARRRLIGMVVLVGAGVLGFPWLFETQPRPMSGDIQIVQAPQAGGSVPGAVVSAATTGVTIAAVTAPSRGVPERSPRTEPGAEREEFVKDAPSRPAAPVAVQGPVASAAKPAAKPDVKPAVPPVAAAAPKPPAPKPVAQAASKLPAKPAEKDKPLVRYVVQFGAFADAAAAQEARLKAERQGLKTYAQQVDTPQGKRIRVRLGPFTDKAEADKAAAALRKAGLPGAVLTL